MSLLFISKAYDSGKIYICKSKKDWLTAFHDWGKKLKI